MTEYSKYHRYSGHGVITIDERALAADAGVGVPRMGRRAFKAACLDGCSGIAIEKAS